VRECAEAHEILRKHARDLPHLAAYTEADLTAAGDALSGVHRSRARHVVHEMMRIGDGVEALRRGDLHGLGAAMSASHRSTSVDYDVSCDELDHLTATACELDVVFGARLTGAGFGGCAIALVSEGRDDEVEEHVRSSYDARFGVAPAFRVMHAGGGPRRLA
jgi:galactokinase